MFDTAYAHSHTDILTFRQLRTEVPTQQRGAHSGQTVPHVFACGQLEIGLEHSNLLLENLDLCLTGNILYNSSHDHL